MSRATHQTSHRLSAALLACVVLLPLTGCGSEEKPFTYEGASVLLVDLSGLRADRLGAGPELEALARESVSFEWAFTPSPHAGPSRAALLSGRYPVALGLLADGGTLTEEVTTLAERFSDRGYRTAAFVGAKGEPEIAGIEQGFGGWQALDGGLDAVAAEALTWLRSDQDAPFFLYLQASDLVSPLEGLPVEGASVVDGEAVEAERERLEASYDERVRVVGGQVGELLGALREMGVADRTVVVLTSDRGVELAEHGASGDGGVHATVARVPFLLRLPDGTARVESRITDLVDVAPTLLDLVGLEAVDEMQGESLVAVLDQRGEPPYLAFTDSIEPEGGLAVAMAGYRLVLRRADDRAELYRLSDDPFELADIAADEPEKVEVLRRRLEEWQLGLLGGGAGGDGASADDETLEQLRNLGYIQ